MSLYAILELILIGPLKLVFEILFELAHRFTGHPGLAIVALSLMMNLMVLPLYRSADAMQEKARDIDEKLRRGVEHIKKTFSKDEQMMILQTYYRQNNYKPTDALGGSVSLLLEIPFFMAAYQFLSHLEVLNGVSFGPIADLGAPDGLIVLGAVSINLLPFVMTIVNIISSAIYLKGFPLKSKIQMYSMALFFLVFLYTSPSCLLLYWTLNNVFSLVKTIFYKLPHPKKTVDILCVLSGLAVLFFGLFVYQTNSFKRKAIVFFIGVCLELPLILKLLKHQIHLSLKFEKPNRIHFQLGLLFLTVIVGVFIPSVYLSASPQEYVDLSYFHHPLYYLFNTLCMSVGTFFVWFNVFYSLADDRWKSIFEKLVLTVSVLMLINYMFFGTDLGIISSSLKYEADMVFSRMDQIVNLGVLIIAGALMLILMQWKKNAVIFGCLCIVLAISGMSFINGKTVYDSIGDVALKQDSYMNDTPYLQLNKQGKNVVVIMLDRAAGEYIPYIFNEKPDLKKKYDGFTYYSNVISYGRYTNFGSPAMLGGYEYTPVEMNRRSTESLVSKHNEALMVMPVLFSQNDFQVTVCDPTYANYSWIPDLSLFDGYDGIRSFVTKGRFSDTAKKQGIIDKTKRNFFVFSLMKTMPVLLQPTLYDEGNYNQSKKSAASVEYEYSAQTVEGLSKSYGVSKEFMDPYDVLQNMNNMTQITDSNQNTYLFLSNDATHEPILLQTPDYTVSESVDNTDYDLTHESRFDVDEKKIVMETSRQMIHYHANMAALIQIGNWLEMLKENNVYDNTRIILVSDHGYPLHHFSELILDDGTDDSYNIEAYFPLLMVKDFYSEGFVESDEFMTNADVPLMAFDGLVNNPVNPFTGKELSDNEKYAHDQYLITSNEWDTNFNNGNQFLPSSWLSVKDDIWNQENWSVYEGEMVLEEHFAQ